MAGEELETTYVPSVVLTMSSSVPLLAEKDRLSSFDKVALAEEITAIEATSEGRSHTRIPTHNVHTPHRPTKIIVNNAPEVDEWISRQVPARC